MMRKTFALLLAGFSMAVSCLAQELLAPTLHIFPEDVVQDSVQQVRFGTNSVAVRFTYTEAGARKKLAFHDAHAGQRGVIRVGNFERHVLIAARESRPAGWTEAGWLRRRTDKFLGVSEDDAKRIVAGLKFK